MRIFGAILLLLVATTAQATSCPVFASWVSGDIGTGCGKLASDGSWACILGGHESGGCYGSGVPGEHSACTYPPVPATELSTSFSKVVATGGPEAGSDNVNDWCGITTSDGSIVCWNWTADRYDITGIMSHSPEGTGFKDIASADEFWCAIASDDTVTCWGREPKEGTGCGSAPHYGCASSSTSYDLAGPISWHSPNSGPTGTFTRLQNASSINFMCGVTTDGHLQCWGNTWDHAAVVAAIPSTTGWDYVSTDQNWSVCGHKSGDDSISCVWQPTLSSVNPSSVVTTDLPAHAYVGASMVSTHFAGAAAPTEPRVCALYPTNKALCYSATGVDVTPGYMKTRVVSGLGSNNSGFWAVNAYNITGTRTHAGSIVSDFNNLYVCPIIPGSGVISEVIN